MELTRRAFLGGVAGATAAGILYSSTFRIEPAAAAGSQLPTYYSNIRGMNYDPTFDLWTPESFMPGHYRGDIVRADLALLVAAGYNAIRVFSPMLDGPQYPTIVANLSAYGDAFEDLLVACRALGLKVLYVIWNHTTVDSGQLSTTAPTSANRNSSYSLYSYLQYWMTRFDSAYADVLLSWSMDNEPDPQGQSTTNYPIYSAYIQWIYTTLKGLGATVPLSTGYIDAPNWDTAIPSYNDFLEYHLYVWPGPAMDTEYNAAHTVAINAGKALLITETGMPGAIDGDKFVQPYDDAESYFQSNSIGYMDWGNRLSDFQGLFDIDGRMDISNKTYSQVKLYSKWGLLGAPGYDWTGGGASPERTDSWWSMFDTVISDVESGTTDKATLYNDLQTVYDFARSAVGYWTPSFYAKYSYPAFQAATYASNLQSIQAAIDMLIPYVRSTFARANQLRDFSSTQGTNNWTYLYGTVPSTTPMVWSTDHWAIPGDAYASADKYGLSLPSSSQEVIRRWTAPTNGLVHLTGSVAKGDTGGGNGVTAFIHHNITQELFYTQLAYNNSTGVAFDQKLWIKAGDTLSFTVDAIGSNTNDGTLWDINIDYTEPVVANVADFSTVQGTENVKYLSGTVSSNSPMTLTSGVWKAGDWGTLDGNGFFHPSSTGDTIWQWTAPYTGTVFVVGTYTKNVGDGSGDGDVISIFHNTSSAWSTLLAATDANLYYFDSTLPGSQGIAVVAGDTVSITVNKNSTTTNDGVIMNFKLRYQSDAWGRVANNAQGGSGVVRYDYASNASAQSPYNQDQHLPMKYIRGAGVNGTTALRSDQSIQRVTLGSYLHASHTYNCSIAVKPGAETKAGLILCTDQYFYRVGNCYPEIRIMATNSSTKTVTVEQIPSTSTVYSSSFANIDSNFKSPLVTVATFSLLSADYDSNGFVALRVNFSVPSSVGGTITGTVYANGRSLGTFSCADPGGRKVGISTAPVNLAKYGFASFFDNLLLADATSGTTVFSDDFENSAYSGQAQVYPAPELNWSVLRRLFTIDTEIIRKIGGAIGQNLQSTTSASSSKSGGDITVNWSDTSTRESGFIIQRLLSGSSTWNEIWRSLPKTTSATFPDTTSGASYTYRVLAMHYNPAQD